MAFAPKEDPPMPMTEKYLNFLYFFKSLSLNESLYLFDKLNRNKSFLFLLVLYPSGILGNN